MASPVVKLRPSKPEPLKGPLIHLQRSASGFGFVVGYRGADGHEDSHHEFGDYDAALVAAQERSHRHRVKLHDSTGIPAPKRPRPKLVPTETKSLSFDHIKKTVEDLPDMFEGFDLPELTVSPEQKIDFPLLERHASDRFKMMQVRALDEHREKFGDSRNVARTFTQATHDQTQAQLRLIVENMLVKHCSLLGYLELAFARIAELQAAPKGLNYRGVYKAGETYEPHDCATWGGSLWFCKQATTEKPDVGPWQLCVKKGRDGRDGKDAPNVG